MKYVAAESWRPQGITDLEDAAWTALREQGCTSVVAGPGAGKTEFLAQRAAYLLQTGICRKPSRILAISFKKDAAENLKARVEKRCSPEFAARFDSFTFDAFTKNLVDRFRDALPEIWQPSKPYKVAFPSDREKEQFLQTARTKAVQEWRLEIARIDAVNFESRHVGAQKLAAEVVAPTTAIDFAIDRWWERNLRREVSEVSFVMFNRLAELLLRTRPQILRSLQLTYPFVFVDEFQDTTHGQYDFLLSAFGDGQTVVTAVGDNKQRIMGWAGALPNAFEQFQTDFSATEIALRSNHRSSPDLVRIQQVVARAIDAQSAEAESQTIRTVEGEVAQVWNFPNNETEAQRIAAWLAEDMQRRGTSPRDYALLARQRVNLFEEQLLPALNEKGIQLRNESRRIGEMALQDLLVDELARISMSIMKLAVLPRVPEAWDIASEAVLRLRGVDPDDEVACQKTERQLKAFVDRLRNYLRKASPHPTYAGVIVKNLLEFLDPAALARAYPGYGTLDNLTISMESFRLHFAESARGAVSWEVCVNKFEGKDCVPLMTVHKSKGLEYDTIIFLSLDNRTWWNRPRRNAEGVATFFVALSRAKQQVVFTFCASLGSQDVVEDLYALLKEAGVSEVEYSATQAA